MTSDDSYFDTPSVKEEPSIQSACETLKLRIGQIRYSNVIPFFHGLKSDDLSKLEVCESSKKAIQFSFVEDSPAGLNQALRLGDIDVGPISSLAYLQNQEDYLILPDLAIGARDFSGSVILFSKDRIEGLNHAKIALTSESLSSITLLKVMLRYKYHFDNEFVMVDSNDPRVMLNQYSAGLVIGDEALFFQPEEFVYKYDLSELWWNWTSKPFCFSVWAVRRDFAERYVEEISWFCHRVRSLRDRNLGNLEQLLKESAGLNFMDPKFSKLFGYLFNLSFSLDETMQEGLELFYRLAYRYGMVPQPQKLQFVKHPD